VKVALAREREMNKSRENHDIASDALLVKKILSGQRDSFADIVRRYQNRIYGMALSYTRNPEEARDLTQDSLVAVYNSLARFDQTRSLTNWVLKIAVYHCYQYLRKSRRPAKVLDLPAEFPDPLDVQVRADQREKVLKAFDGLGEDLKMTVWLHYFLERSCKEIAEILEISLDLVKVRLFRARKVLGEILGAAEPEE
jgi:RNA polymerase sigma-70 factor (ECF subfamily)